MARLIVIGCEGRTESEYFKILEKVFRIFRLSIHPELGQHKALIKRTAEKRDELSKELGIDVEDIECWSVCDDDKMPFQYNELKEFAHDCGVNLAFSRPMFEAYLVQHFQQTGAYKRKELYDILTEERNRNSYDGPYKDSTKSDLTWLKEAIDKKPRIVKTAITNSNLRTKQTSSCFLTVQNLTERLLKNAL